MQGVVVRTFLEIKGVKKTHTLGPLLEVQMWEKCTALWQEACFEDKTKASKTDGIVSDHSWRFKRGKSACPCGTNRISKSKSQQHHMLGSILDVQRRHNNNDDDEDEEDDHHHRHRHKQQPKPTTTNPPPPTNYQQPPTNTHPPTHPPT